MFERSMRLGITPLSFGEGYIKRIVFMGSAFEGKWHAPIVAEANFISPPSRY